MKRFLFSLVATIACAFLVPIFAQHHQSAAETTPLSNSGPLSSATVTFGAFMSHPRTCPTPPTPCPVLDRFVPGVNSTAYNHHSLTPELATIKAGGTVNFIMSGFHVLAIYDDGTQPSDIDVSIIVPPTIPDGPPRAPAIMADSRNRIYRGLDPVLLPAGGLRSDRVEAFRFDKPGLYLVICAVVSHFNDGMYGYVRVLPLDDGLVEKSK